MRELSAKTRLIAAITAIAVALVCVFAAVFYTRAGLETPAGEPEQGEVAAAQPLDYGDATGGIPSGAVAIGDQTAFYAFINGAASYGYLTADITLSTWVRGDLVLESGRTLDGNGHTVTVNNSGSNNHMSPYLGSFEGNTHIGTRQNYTDWWAADNVNGTYALGNGKSAYAFSDIVSANYGTIKNMKVVMAGNSDSAIEHIAISPEDGNVVMGVIAGFNAGTIQNVSVTINDRYGLLPSELIVEGQSNTRLYSVQDMVAVGGIAGYNTGNIVGSEVSIPNGALGIFKAEKYFDNGRLWPNNVSGTVYNFPIDSGSVGGVAGVNDGGSVDGVSVSGIAWLYNNVWHYQTSYTGLVVGLANLTTASATYNLDGSANWTVAPGKINNLELSWAGGCSFVAEAHANASLQTNVVKDTYVSVGAYGTGFPQSSWTATGNYVGIIGGRLGTSATNTSLANYINVYNTDFGSGRWNYHPWTIKEVNSTYSLDTADMPIFGYGDGATNYTRTVNDPVTRMDGQARYGDGTNLTSVGATASYIWSGYVDDSGEAHSGLLQNIDLGGLSDFAGKSHKIFKFEGYVGGALVNGEGGDDYDGADIGISHFAEIPQYSSAGSVSVEYRYSVTAYDFHDSASVQAFLSGESSYGFGYAFANAVIMTGANSVSGLVASGERVLADWKTLDGRGNTLSVGMNAGVNSYASTQTVGGVSFYAVGDLISVNNGTVKDVTVNFDSAAARQIGLPSGSSAVAYGGIVGINNGELSNVAYNGAGGANTALTLNAQGVGYVALGAVAGVNLGSMNGVSAIIWQDLGSSGAGSGTFVGGIAGLNDGAGTIKNAKIGGEATASMTAVGGEAYLGGILGLGANGTGGGRTVGALSVTGTSTDSPFGNWFFTGKQTMTASSGTYVGMLAGGATSSAVASADNPAIAGMIVAMPDSEHELGWFTPDAGTASLLGRADGTASAAGYIATDLVGGYVVVAQDASDLFVSAAISDYKGEVNADGSASVTFVSDIYQGHQYIEQFTSLTAEYLYATGLEQYATLVPNIQSSAQTVSFAAGAASAQNAANENNYAQTVVLHYRYTARINQSFSDSDGSSSQHALTLFLSGKAREAGLSAYPGSYKAIAAGAASARITGALTLNSAPSGIVFSAPKETLDGGGNTVTFGTAAASFDTAGYYFADGDRNATGDLVAVNEGTISDLDIVINGSRELTGSDILYAPAAAVNLGTMSNIGVTVNAPLTVSSSGGCAVVGGTVAVNAYPASLTDIGYNANAAVTLSGSYSLGYIGAVGFNSEGSAEGLTAVWNAGIYMGGSDGAANIFGGAVGATTGGNVSDASVTMGAGLGDDGLLDGGQYTNAIRIVLSGGGSASVGGIVGSISGGSLSDSALTANADVAVVKNGGGVAGNFDVGGIAGTAAGGSLSGVTAGGFGALAYVGAGNVRIGGAAGALGGATSVSGAVAALSGGVYNNDGGDYGYFAGRSENGVTVENSFWHVFDDAAFAINAVGAPSVFGDGDAPALASSAGYRVTDTAGSTADYATFGVSVSGSSLTLSVTNMLPDFAASAQLSASGSDRGAAQVTVAGGNGSTTELTIGSYVRIYTDNSRDENMLLSFLSGRAYAVVAGAHNVRGIDGRGGWADSAYRYYGWYAGADEAQLIAMNASSSDKNVTMSSGTEIGLVLGAGKTLHGNESGGYTVTVTADMDKNIAPEVMIWREETQSGTTEIVNSGLYAAKGMFLARNEGTLLELSVTVGSGAGDALVVDYGDVIELAEDAYPPAEQVGADGTAFTSYNGVIFGMLIGVNRGVISGFPSVTYDKITRLAADGSYGDAIVGGMVGAQLGEGSVIEDVGEVVFEAETGVSVTGSGMINRISVGGLIGMVSNEDNDTSIDGLAVEMKAYGFIDIDVSHNFAALGGIVGDLRGVMSGARFETEYLSRILINGTLSGGTAALGGLAGVINGATVGTSVVKGIGYMYNGVTTDSASASASLDLYSGGAIGLGANYAVDTSTAAATYRRINPSVIDSVYVDFEGYLRALAGTKVGIVTGRLFDGVTADAVAVNTDAVRNVVWKVNYYGDVPWASSEYVDNVSTAFNERDNLAVFGYAPQTVDGYDAARAQMGMRLWVTNNRYSGETNNTISATWQSSGNLRITVDNITSAEDYEAFTAYFNGNAQSGKDGITKISTYHSLGSGDPVAATATVNVADRLASFASAGGMASAHGVYVIRFVFDEVLIYNQAELMTFISGGKNSVSKTTAGATNVSAYMFGLATTDARYSELANADYGVLAGDISVNYGATAVTMPAGKTLFGDGHTVTLTASGTVTAYQMWSNRSDVDDEDASIGILQEGETVRSYISGGENESDGSHFLNADLNAVTETVSRVGAGAGGLLMGRNLGTISSINFVLQNSVTISNSGYGALIAGGIVTAVNAGTIENCSLTLNEGVEFTVAREACSDNGRTNELGNDSEGQINTVVAAGGYAGMMFSDGGNSGLIRNSTLDIKTEAVIATSNEFSTFYWLGRRSSVISYAGGLVGWMLEGSEIYNVILSGEGDIRAWATLDTSSGIDWNEEFAFGIGGIIAGLNSPHNMFNPIAAQWAPDNHGYVNGVICNWNGNVEYSAMYTDGTFTDSGTIYYDVDRHNYSIGGQMIGVSESDALRNVYFMYGVENYSTYHRDNWYYGTTAAARATNAEFEGKYEYLVSQSLKLLELHPEWDAIYAPVATGGENVNPQLVPVALREDGEVVQGELFTFENYNNYTSADPEADGSIFGGVQHTVDNAWGFQIYATTLGSDGRPTSYTDILRTYYHKITEPSIYTSGDTKDEDRVGARTSGKMTTVEGDGVNSPTVYRIEDWSYQYTPNNIYLYEIPFGSNEEVELDMNDPDTVVSLSFETDEIDSDIRLEFELYTDEAQAEFIWSITEEWDYADGSSTSDTTNYYETVNSLEAAQRNNRFDRTMRRDNDSTDLTFIYTIGSAVAIAPDTNRYTGVVETDEEGDITELVYYDGQPQLYNAQALVPPTIYYVNYVTGEQIREATVNQSMFSYWRIPDGGSLDSAVSLGSSAPYDVGEYFIRLSFGGAGDDNLKVNLTDRTVMFGVDTDHYDFYTAIMPRGLTSTQISEIRKTYDGTAESTDLTNFTVSGLVGGDSLRIMGTFEQADVGDDLDFTVDTSGVAYVRTVSGGKVTVNTIAVITSVTGDLTNYAYVRTALADPSQGVETNLGRYYSPGAVARISGSGIIVPYEINRGGISFRLTNGDGELIDFTTNTNVEYRNGYSYDTSSFEGSVVPVGGTSLYMDENGAITEGLFADGDSLQFSFTFGGAESVTDKGDYSVGVSMTSANGNYVLTGSGSIGMLHILAIILDNTAYFNYVMDDIERVYDGTDGLPDFGGTMIVTDKNGHTLSAGSDYTIVLGYSSVEAPVDVGRYELRVNIVSFDGKGNYELDDDIDYRFIPENGGRAAYLFVTPREVVFDSVIKQFDNTGEADPSYTVYNYADGAGPLEAGTEFSGSFPMQSGTAGYSTVGSGKQFAFDTETLTFEDINGARRSYNTLEVAGDASNRNYCVESVTSDIGGITPIEVELTSATKIYDNRTAIDYTAEGTQVIIVRTDNGAQVDIEPSASFDSPRTGSSKTVSFDTVATSVYGETYATLVNSAYSDVTATSGWNYSGNYCVAEDRFMSVGQIVQYTIEWEHIGSIFEVIQILDGREGDSIGFSRSGSASGTLVYMNGYTVEGVLRDGTVGGWPDEDPVQELIEFAIETDAAVLGYAGDYTIVLSIVSPDGLSEPDYVWGDFNNKNSDGDIEFTFEVERQTINASASASASPESSVWSGTASSLSFTASVTDNNGVTLDLSAAEGALVNDTLGGSYENGSVLPIGDYSSTVEVGLVGDDALNYVYGGADPVAEFSILPAQLTVYSVEKEYDDTTSLTTAGNEAQITASVPDGEVDFDAQYVSALPQTSGGVRFAAASYVIGGTRYYVFVGSDGETSNYAAQNVSSADDDSVVINVGVIEKYVITQSELRAYIYGWTRGQTEKQRTEITDGDTHFEYRDNGVYSADEVEFELTLRYGLTATISSRPAVNDGAGSVLDFAVTITGVGADVSEGAGRVLGVGEYDIEISLDNACFALAEGVVSAGGFTIDKQSVSGGSEGEGGYFGGNVLITADAFSYAYGESGFNTPAVTDPKVVLTVTVYDTYSGASYVYSKEVVGQLLYGDAQTDTLTGEVLVGEYKVWATQFADSLENYIIDTQTVLPVFVTGTVLPDGADVGDDGVPVGAEHGAIYAVIPAEAAISSVTKIYDGTVSFDGATIATLPAGLESAVQGRFVSPDATHGSDGTETGEGSRNAYISVYDLTLQGVTYRMLAQSGTAANYCVTGEYSAGEVLVTGVASIYKLSITDLGMLSLTAQPFGREYDGTSSMGVLPEMTLTVTVGENVISVPFTPDAAALVLSLDGEEVAEAVRVGAYGVAVLPNGLGNFEIPEGLGNVPVNGGAAAYYIEPKAVNLDELAKTYDGTPDVTDQTVIVLTGLLDGETASFAIAFSDAAVGLNKSVTVAVTAFEGADGTVFDRIVSTDGAGTDYCIVGGVSDGTQAVLQGSGYTISPAALEATGSAIKTYDGTADITSAASQVFSGFVSGETVQPDWNYDGKDSGTRDVLVRVDTSVVYNVGDAAYYALYTAGEEGWIPGNYGIEFTGDNIVEEEVQIVGEDGVTTTVVYYYALFSGAGRIDPYAISGFTQVLVDGRDISVPREYDRTSSYSLSDVRPSFLVDGVTVTAAYSAGRMSAVTPFGDTLQFNASFSPSSVRDAGSYVLSISLVANANYTMTAYTGGFVIEPKELDGLFVVVPDIMKEYDGTPDLPQTDTSLWKVYGVDGGVTIALSGSVTFGENGGIAFVDADGDEYLPVNVVLADDGTLGGYVFELRDVVFTHNNYIWDSGVVTDIPSSYSVEDGAKGDRSLYIIEPKTIIVSADSFSDKTFDGAFSLRVNDSGVQGEYVSIGDMGGLNASLGGVYGPASIIPYVSGVTFDKTALNPDTTADNYRVVCADGAQALELTGFTVSTGSVFTAERSAGGYRLGFGKLAGFDFLFAAQGMTAENRAAITAGLAGTLATGEPWSETTYDAAGAFAALNEALASLFDIRLNNSADALALDGEYFFNDFLWSEQTDGMGRKYYALTFSFTGAAGYDRDFATDRYSFTLKGKTPDVEGAQYIASTNTSLTSSELGEGQLSAENSQTGVAVSDAEGLLDLLRSGGEGHLTADIYGFDPAGEEISFAGTLYGNGHTVQLAPSELAGVSAGGYKVYGMLAAVNSGTIRDLTVKVLADGEIILDEGSVFGAVGYNSGTIENVGVEIVAPLRVSGAAYVGGIVGYNAAGGTISSSGVTVSADVYLTDGEGAVSGVFGGIAGLAAGTLERVSVRTTEDLYLAGAGGADGRTPVTITVSAAGGGGVIGSGSGAVADGVIAATTRLDGVNGILGSGSAAVSGVYAYSAEGLGIDGEILDSTELTILAPYTDGFISYRFTDRSDYETDGAKHNEIGSSEERNMSLYRIYDDSDGEKIAIEAIAPAGRFIWEGYGLSYRSELIDGNVGTSANRIVAVFAVGASVAQQYEGTDAFTGGVDAYTAAFGIIGSTVVAGTASGVKETVYNGEIQTYTVTLTVTEPDGSTREEQLSVQGTDAGYYSRSSVEGVISGDSDTYGDVTFDIDNRTAVTVVGGEGTVSDGIALIIYPKAADDRSAVKYYDTTDAATLTLTGAGDTDTVSGGRYLDAQGAYAHDVDTAVAAAFVNADTAVRNVIADAEGRFYTLVASVEGDGQQARVVYKLQPAEIETEDGTAPFGLDTDLTAYSAAQIMRAYAKLTDWAELENAAAQPGSDIDIGAYVPARVFAVTGAADESGSAVFSETVGTLYFAPPAAGGNLIAVDTLWIADITTLSAEDFDWTVAAGYKVTGEKVGILPIDLDISAGLKGTDQSYNHALIAPTPDGTVEIGMTFETAQSVYGLTRELYDALIAEAADISVPAAGDLFGALIESGDIISTADGYFAAVKEYKTLTASAQTVDADGNFLVNAGGQLTLRYFEASIGADGSTTYLISDIDDWRALQSNENGVADYNTLDYLLTADIDFGGTGAMLAWTSAEGDIVHFEGSLDGDGHVLSGIFEFNAGERARSALIESNYGTVKDLSVVNSVFDAYGTDSAAAGIAADNHGTIENCTFEGTLASGNSQASSAVLGGIAANNYGVIIGGVSVGRAHAETSADGAVSAAGVAVGAAAGSSVSDSVSVQVLNVYGGSNAEAGGAVVGEGASDGNAFLAGQTFINGTQTAEADTSGDASLTWDGDARCKAVIENYVFDQTLISVSFEGKLVTDSFRKLIAAIRLFGWVGADGVTDTSVAAWGKYAAWLAAHTLR